VAIKTIACTSLLDCNDNATRAPSEWPTGSDTGELAAEHGMRLMAAESAVEWIDRTTVTTARRLSAARSEASTQELLDIVSGSRQRLRDRERIS